MKKDLRSLTEAEIIELAVSIGLPAFRGRQVFAWVHCHGAEDFAGLKNLPQNARDALAEVAFIGVPSVVARLQSKSGNTSKYLFEFADGERVETALMFYARDNSRNRVTCCVSTQSGCSMGCTFCATALCGHGRNLSAGEIISQVLAADREAKERGFSGVTNVVYMGMGEPLLNISEVEKSVRILNSSEGLEIGARRITISTCGIAPAIYEMAQWGLQVELAVSLHAADDEKRVVLMPIARKYGLDELMKACEHYWKITGNKTTFEYAMFDGVNDSGDDAHRLGKLLKGKKVFINIIPANKVTETGFSPSKGESIKAFINIVRDYGIEILAREPRGIDIDAACGQLRRR